MTLWKLPIPVIGVTGEYAAGKTLFLATICAGPDHLNFDTEKSSASYEGQLGFKRVDLPSEMLKLHPGGYKPIDTFIWWQAFIKQIPPGRFKVITLDVAEEIEAGLADYVWENPLERNRTKAQYLKMTGLYWADVKSLWKSILADLASRCETFAFSVHLGSVWGGDNKPIQGKTRPKGKSTLMELSSLFLHLERAKDAAGNVAAKPAATVLKSRLVHLRADGEIVPALPPRLPVATPAALRQYLETPPDYAALRAEERAPEKPVSDVQKLEMLANVANAQADAERLKIERMGMEQRARGQDALEAEPVNAPVASLPDVPAPAVVAAPAPAPPAETVNSTPPAPPTPAESPSVVATINMPFTVAPLNGAAPPPADAASLKAAWTDALMRSTDPGLTDAERTAAKAKADALKPPPPASQGNHFNNVRALWEEFALRKNLTQEQKTGMWPVLLQRYGGDAAGNLNAIKADQLVALEGFLAGKVQEEVALAEAKRF